MQVVEFLVNRKGIKKRMSAQQVSLNECYARQKSGVLTKHVSDEMVIIDMKNGIYHGLNPVGVQIWQNLDGKNSLNQIVEQLSASYDGVDKAIIEADTLSLVQVLLDNELVKLS